MTLTFCSSSSKTFKYKHDQNQEHLSNKISSRKPCQVSLSILNNTSSFAWLTTCLRPLPLTSKSIYDIPSPLVLPHILHMHTSLPFPPLLSLSRSHSHSFLFSSLWPLLLWLSKSSQNSFPNGQEIPKSIREKQKPCKLMLEVAAEDDNW